MMTRYSGHPMDLANMREIGVRWLHASCLDCRHDADVNVDGYPGHLEVPSFASFMATRQVFPSHRPCRPGMPFRANRIR